MQPFSAHNSWIQDHEAHPSFDQYRTVSSTNTEAIALDDRQASYLQSMLYQGKSVRVNCDAFQYLFYPVFYDPYQTHPLPTVQPVKAQVLPMKNNVSDVIQQAQNALINCYFSIDTIPEDMSSVTSDMLARYNINVSKASIYALKALSACNEIKEALFGLSQQNISLMSDKVDRVETACSSINKEIGQTFKAIEEIAQRLLSSAAQANVKQTITDLSIIYAAKRIKNVIHDALQKIAMFDDARSNHLGMPYKEDLMATKLLCKTSLIKKSSCSDQI